MASSLIKRHECKYIVSIAKPPNLFSSRFDTLIVPKDGEVRKLAWISESDFYLIDPDDTEIGRNDKIMTWDI